jgi:hypothetical protein
VANQVFTYRGDTVSDRSYRKAFDKNNLPDLYSMWTFFNKDSQMVKEFFDLGRSIIKNPIEFSNTFLHQHKPKVLGTDEAFALSAKLLDIENDIAYPLDFPKIIHLKPLIQNWPWDAECVTDHAGFYLKGNGSLKIGNYQQTDIIHYVEKDIITDEFISMLEEIAWKKN